MKNTRLLILMLALVFSWSACENEVNLASDWKDIPIVYGLINSEDAVHYVRVEKAFLDPQGNAFQTAQIADSLYYQSVTVELENITTGDRVVMERVNAEEEGFEREEGVFATSPNYVFKAFAQNIPMEDDHELRLLINRGDALPLVTAEAPVVGGLSPSPTLVPGVKLDFEYDDETNFRWVTSDEDSRIFDLKLRVRYFEKEIANPNNITEHAVEWVMAKGVPRNGASSSTFTNVFGLGFYQFLDEAIETNPNVERGLQALDVIILGGGEAIAEYIGITLANTGITSSQDIPVFTNLSEGRGIFSTVTTLEINNLTITQDTRDSLLFGQYTGDLNFVQ